MNHVKVLSRFVAVVFWLAFLGITYSVVMHSGNILSLSWITLLIYGCFAAVTAYVGFFVSKYLWSIK